MKVLLAGLAISSVGFLTLQETALNFPTIMLNSNNKEVAVHKEKQVISFTSSVKYGKQEGQISVLLSTDFDGNYNEENLQKATWKTIGKTVKLASGEESENSGDIDVSNMVDDGKPYYVAFRSLGNASVKPVQRSWSITNLKVSETAIQKFNIINFASNAEGAGWIAAKGGILFRSNHAVTKSESWAIVKL